MVRGRAPVAGVEASVQALAAQALG
jgi:hypothetical protein